MTETGTGKPQISFEEAYSAIRTWYREHVDDPEYAGRLTGKSRPLIQALPEAADASELEMRALFGEVIGGSLTWGYKKSDGTRRMAEYAHGALEGAGIEYDIADPAEREELKASPLWPYLFCPRHW